MRDKLIELITVGFSKCTKPYEVYAQLDLEALADYLIAHGVMVQEWIPVSERLPEEAGEYNVMIKGAEIATSLWYSRLSNGWYNFDDDYYEETYDDVTHWMPLPEAPKEVE